MEMITELFVKKICSMNNYRYLSQATSHKIKTSFGYNVSVDKSERSFDFAIDNGHKLYLVETNYYGGGGSKLKSVAGEFTTCLALSKKRHRNMALFGSQTVKAGKLQKNLLGSRLTR